MKKISSVFNICFTVFLFLFALEPILGSYAPYWYAMYAFIAVGIVVLLTTIINGFRKKIFPLKQFTKIDATSYILPFISVLGIFISLEYDTSFLDFWIFMLILDVLPIAVTIFRKPKKHH